MTTPATRRIFIAYPWNLYQDREAYKNAYVQLEKALQVKFVFAEERVSTDGSRARQDHQHDKRGGVRHL